MDIANPFDPEDERRRLADAFSGDSDSDEIELGTRLDTGRPARIPLRAFDRHTQVIGTTGGGKSYLLRHIFHQLATRADSAVVFFDPSGDAYHRLKRWAYSERLDSRLVLIDPSEQRLICGINPVAPWPGNHHLQAALAWDTMRRAMDDAEFSSTPLLELWMCNVLYGLISTGLTIHEAPNLLAFEDGGFRDAVMAAMPDSDERSDFGILGRLINDQRTGPALRDWQLQVGAAHRRLRRYARNDYLAKMLGTTQHVVDWGEVLDKKKIVLVNLNPSGDRRIYLSPTDVRMFGLQLLSQLIEECFHRVEAADIKAPPCYCFVDEFQHFVSTNVERVLSEGRKFNLRLILAHRSPAELYDRRTGDDVLMRLVASCTQLKFVFGGLDWKDCETLAWTLGAHHINLKEVKDEIRTVSQLHHLEEVESRMEGRSESESTGQYSVAGKSESYNAELEQMASGVSSVMGNSLGTVRGWNTSTSRHQMVVPGDPFLQTTGRQFYSIDEQLHKVISRLVGQPDQHATVAVGKDCPIEFKVTTLHEPAITYEQTKGLDLELMRSLSYYAEPALIEEEIRDRSSRLLAAVHPLPTPIREIDRVEEDPPLAVVPPSRSVARQKPRRANKRGPQEPR